MVSIDTSADSYQTPNMGKPNNHPAFPVTGYPGDKNLPPVRPNTGMGIRDWFAGMAVQGLLAGTETVFDVLGSMTEFERLAERAYQVADAMMIEREEK